MATIRRRRIEISLALVVLVSYVHGSLDSGGKSLHLPAELPDKSEKETSPDKSSA